MRNGANGIRVLDEKGIGNVPGLSPPMQTISDEASCSNNLVIRRRIYVELAGKWKIYGAIKYSSSSDGRYGQR